MNEYKEETYSSDINHTFTPKNDCEALKYT